MSGPDGERLTELIEEVYGPLADVFERLESGRDPEAVGWAAHLGALRALREQRTVGDWEALARLLVAPEGGPPEVATFAEAQQLVEELLADGERALVVASSPERAEEVVRALTKSADVFALLAEVCPPEPPDESATRMDLPVLTSDDLPPPDEATTPLELLEPLATPDDATTPLEPLLDSQTRVDLPVPEPVRDEAEDGRNGTIEFAAVRPEDLEAADSVDTVEDEPDTTVEDETVEDEPDEAPPVARAPEGVVTGVALRAVGDAWRSAWGDEGRLLKRGLLWLEQWPRDAANLESLVRQQERRREALSSDIAALETRIDELGKAIASAEQAAAEAAEECVRLDGERETIAAELAEPQAEAERLQRVADEAGAAASQATRIADTAFARVNQIDQRGRQAQAELAAAAEQEAGLTADLTRAHEELPAVAEEAERLNSEAADAAAEGHARYYRLVSAESALAARKRKLSLGQRLHVAAPPPDLKDLRHQVKTRKREADSAAERATKAKDAAEGVENRRAEIARFISEGEARLAAAKEAQVRLGAELEKLKADRETAIAEHREQSRVAAEAVDRATQAGAEARVAQQVVGEINERIAVVQSKREEADARRRRTEQEREAAASRRDESQSALVMRRDEGELELAEIGREIEAATEAEQRSRDNVREVCGGDPEERAEVYRNRAMARIEQLTGYMDGTGDLTPLVPNAGVVCGTPLTLGALPEDAEFDAMVVIGPEEITDVEFLIGAVRSRQWFLAEGDGGTPPQYEEYSDLALLSLAQRVGHPRE
ncbi:hypothetical protein [Spirillospora sp. CA-294931]|uniref:hypothetical protein n=1 Tax=Spirillospora sp. CA-294931 TaxID=3240042 RepID=UPI003D90025B